jgi:hypothetical protein
LIVFQVESVLMRLMSLKLVIGQIDEVTTTVSVKWIQPRELDLQSIETLSKQLAKWNEK